MDLITYLSIDDLLYVKEFKELCNILAINIKSEWLEEKYNSIIRGQGDALIFYSKDEKSFIYIDMYFSPTDQHNMIKFGVRATKNIEKEVYKIIYIIHSNTIVKSEIQNGEDILGDVADRHKYPKIIPTITKDENDQIVYEYIQRLEEYWI